MTPVETTLAPTAAPDADALWERYGEYLRRAPELVLEWTDAETEARGWLVINSLRGGAAGGGTRMRAGLTRQEVVYLAKTMELKFTYAGPEIGGAKSGIDFDPTDPRRAGVLRRWFHAVAPMLHRCYGTGGDLNVDEVLDVIPACAEIGLSHPQEGVARGHMRPDEETLPKILASLDHGVKAPVTDSFGIAGMRPPVADLITGYGLAQSVLRLYELQGRTVEGARVVVEGFGAVGGPCALYLARAGMKVVAIADREKTLVEPEGMGADEVEALLRARQDKLLPAGDARCQWGRAADTLTELAAEVFVAAAASGTLDEAALARLEVQGVEVIACGANQPFREAELGATAVQRAADARFTVIPDVIANCGMARAFSYLMQHTSLGDPAPIFHAVDETITGSLREVSARAGGRPRGLLAASFGYALERGRAREP
jgi:glutamate dehydrogenase (NAD(P)+)